MQKLGLPYYKTNATQKIGFETNFTSPPKPFKKTIFKKSKYGHKSQKETISGDFTFLKPTISQYFS